MTTPPKKSKLVWKNILAELDKQGLTDRAMYGRDFNDDDQTYTVYGQFTSTTLDALTDHCPVWVEPFTISGIRVWKKNRRLSERMRFVNHIAGMYFGDNQYLYYQNEPHVFSYRNGRFECEGKCASWDKRRDRITVKVLVYTGNRSQSFYWMDRII